MAFINFHAQDHFNTKLYTGNGSTNAQTGIGFTPSLTWIKNRSDTHAHVLVDAVRGVTKELRSNGNNSQITTSNSFTSFDTDGFTLGADSTDSYNKNSNNYISWNWKGAGAGSSNSDGSITASVSANPTAGISIGTYTGTGSNASVGHGLNAIPEMIIVKGVTHTSQWYVYTKSTSASTATPPFTAAGKVCTLDTNAAATNDTISWQNTHPTSSEFYIGNDGGTNSSGNTMMFIAFAPKKGFSSFQHYRGNANSNGTYINLNFKPQFCIFKQVDSTGNWIIKSRNLSATNPNNAYMFANGTDAESSASTIGVDFLSTGVKIRGTAGDINGNTNNFIMMAFADQPLVNSNGVPSTAD